MQNIGFLLLNTSLRSYTVDKMSPYLEKEYSPYIFHIDSLTKDRATRSKILDSQIFDVGPLSTKEIIDLFKLLNIRVLVFFTFQSDFDKYMLRICRILNILTILHDHGIVFGSKIARGAVTLNYYSIYRKLHFFLKLKQLKQIKAKKATYFDRYIFFSKNNKQYYNNFFELTDQNTLLSGLSIYDSREQYEKLCQNQVCNYFLYIHQPFIKFRFSTISLKMEIEYFKQIHEILKVFNYDMVIRLHPSVDKKLYKELLLKHDILIDNNTDLNQQVSMSSGVIGHWSTALASALVFHKPLFVVPYPNIKKEFNEYYLIFKNVSCFCTSISDMKNLLNSKSCLTTAESDVIDIIGKINSHKDNGIFFNNLLNTLIL